MTKLLVSLQDGKCSLWFNARATRQDLRAPRKVYSPTNRLFRVHLRMPPMHVLSAHTPSSTNISCGEKAQKFNRVWLRFSPRQKINWLLLLFSFLNWQHLEYGQFSFSFSGRHLLLLQGNLRGDLGNKIGLWL